MSTADDRFGELISAAERFVGPGVGTGPPKDRQRQSTGRLPLPVKRPKVLLRVKLPDGTQATRNTHHDYKLVVALELEPGDYWYDEHGQKWGVWGWTTNVKGVDRMHREINRAHGRPRTTKVLPVINDRA